MFHEGALCRLKQRRIHRKILRIVQYVASLFGIAFLLIMATVIVPRFVADLENATLTKLNIDTEQGVVNNLDIQQAIEDGHYQKAITYINAGLRYQPDNAMLATMQSQLMQELVVDLQFHYRKAQNAAVAKEAESSELTLTSQDPYHLTVDLSDRCYLYIFQLDNQGNFYQLYPNSQYVHNQNPAPGGQVRLPDGQEWFYLDEIPGQENIYMIASRWPQTQLQEMSAEIINQADENTRNDLVKRFVQRLLFENDATDIVPGLVFAEYQFKHEESFTQSQLSQRNYQNRAGEQI